MDVDQDFPPAALQNTIGEISDLPLKNVAPVPTVDKIGVALTGNISDSPTHVSVSEAASLHQPADLSFLPLSLLLLCLLKTERRTVRHLRKMSGHSSQPSSHPLHGTSP